MRNSTAMVRSRNPSARPAHCLVPLRGVQTIRGSGDCEFASRQVPLCCRSGENLRFIYVPPHRLSSFLQLFLLHLSSAF